MKKLKEVWNNEKLTLSAKMLYADIYVHIYDECNEVEISNKEIEERLQITKEKLRKAKEQLLEFRYIEIEQGINKNKFTKYKLI